MSTETERCVGKAYDVRCDFMRQNNTDHYVCLSKLYVHDEYVQFLTKVQSSFAQCQRRPGCSLRGCMIVLLYSSLYAASCLHSNTSADFSCSSTSFKRLNLLCFVLFNQYILSVQLELDNKRLNV